MYTKELEMSLYIATVKSAIDKAGLSVSETELIKIANAVCDDFIKRFK